jgi:hypothetical protein
LPGKGDHASGATPPAFVRTSAAANAASSTTISVSAFDLDAGNCVLIFTAGTTTTASISVDGNAATLVRRISISDPYYVEAWVYPNVGNNNSATITATYSSAATFRSIRVGTWSGIATSSPVSESASNSASDNALVSPATTNRTSQNITTSAERLLVGFFHNWDDTRTPTAATNWTLRSAASAETTSFVDRLAASGTYPSGNFATTDLTNRYVSFIIALIPL